MVLSTGEWKEFYVVLEFVRISKKNKDIKCVKEKNRILCGNDKMWLKEWIIKSTRIQIYGRDSKNLEFDHLKV